MDMLIHSWKSFLPYYFALNKHNYARFGSYYLLSLINMENQHPGLKQLLSDKGLSVQGQSRYKLRTATDQRGEQTINKEAKQQVRTV